MTECGWCGSPDGDACTCQATVETEREPDPMDDYDGWVDYCNDRAKDREMEGGE